PRWAGRAAATRGASARGYPRAGERRRRSTWGSPRWTIRPRGGTGLGGPCTTGAAAAIADAALHATGETRPRPPDHPGQAAPRRTRAAPSPRARPRGRRRHGHAGPVTPGGA